MMRIRVVLAAVAATVAGAALLLAQPRPAAERGVTSTTITFGVEELVNSYQKTIWMLKSFLKG